MDRRSVVLIAMYDIDSFPVRMLHAVLAREGFPVHSIFFKQLNSNNTMDPETEGDIKALIDFLRRLNPILVGLSVRSTTFQLAARLSAAIKSEIGCTVLWGGVHVTISPEECLDHADAICLGEGEGALAEFAGRVADNASWDGIANIWFKRGGEIIRHDLRPLIHDLDSLPFTDFSDTDKYLVEKGQCRPLSGQTERNVYWIMTSRGCPFSCSYCCNSALRRVYKGCGSYVRRRSVEHVLDELTLACKNFPKVSWISFWDDLFAFDIEWIRRFHVRYAKEIGRPFFCYCHPKVVTDEMIGMLRASGATAMTMGIQSASERVRREFFHRSGTNEEIVRAARVLNRHGIVCSYDIIMDNPLEEEQDRRQMLDLLLELPRPFELHTTTLTHFPHTEMTLLLLERGLIRSEDVEHIARKSCERWAPSLDLRRDRENLFWDNLYYLTSKGVSERLIRSLSRSRLLRRKPSLLTVMLRLTSNYIQTVGYDSKFDMLRFRLVNKVREGIARLRRA